MTDEIWKDILGHEGLYQVSSFGRVRSLDKQVLARYGSYRTVVGKIMKTTPNKKGYVKVVLYGKDGGDAKTFLLHRLVAMAFIAGDFNLTVNHIDFNPSNNHPSNLEWVTQRENLDHSIRNGRGVDNLKPAKRITDECQKLSMATFFLFNSQRKTCLLFSVNEKYIRDILFGDTNKEFTKIFREIKILKDKGYESIRATNI